MFLDMCDNIMPIVRLIKNGVLPLFQIGIPIILIVLGTIDLGKAVMASKEDEIKSAQKLLIKRCIYAVAIFFVVTIVTVVFGIISSANADVNGNSQSWSTCWSKA